MSQEEDENGIINEREYDEEELKAEREGENLFGDDWLDDYKEIEEQEDYDPEQIDDTEYNALTIQERLEAEEAMRRRDGKKSIHEKDDELDNVNKMEDDIEDISASDGSEDSSDDEEINLEDYKGPLKEWIVQSGPRREIARRFQDFLVTYQEHKILVYEERIKRMAAENLKSLPVSYQHLSIAVPLLSIWLGDEPVEMLKIFDEVAYQVVLSKFQNYHKIHNEIHVRITDLPIIESLRDLRQLHLNQLIRVVGVVTRRTQVYPQLKLVKFDCGKCGSLVGPIVINTRGNTIPKPGSCPSCQSKGPFSINQHHTIYRNYQKITLQETPGSIPPGRIPRSKDIILLDDLIDSVRPGEEVDITGVYKHNYDVSLNMRQGFPVFCTVIEANYIAKKEDKSINDQISKEEKKIIRELSKDPNIQERIISSIAPSIYGHRNIKLALALALFGGQSKNIEGKHRIRGDINVLLVGDPGTAKSQFLKYLEKTAHRAVYTTGKGSTAVGLTAAVHKDPVTREWTLEGGALVLADNGMCMIDEFDKMSDQDRTSIHEAMEQQTISISKAGIVTTLQARCSIVAAANPIHGRYEPAKTFKQNVDLSDPILSRFDVLCVVKDSVDPIMDESLATFVVKSHVKSHPTNKKLNSITETTDDKIIPQDLLRKYIMYAKHNYHPKHQNLDIDKVCKFYAELRRESFLGGGIPVAIRHIESCMRLAEASARMHLRDYVRADDINTAIAVVLDSFISSQKYSVSQQLRRKFTKYLISEKDNNQLLFHILQNMVKEAYQVLSQHEDYVSIPYDEFEARAKKMNIFKVHPFFKSSLFIEHGFFYDAKKKLIKKHF